MNAGLPGLATSSGPLRAYETKDREAIERLLAPDLRFSSPLHGCIDRATGSHRFSRVPRAHPFDPAVVEEQAREAMSAVRMLGLELHVLKASTEAQLEAVFADLSPSQISGLVVAPEAFFTSHIGQLAALAVRHKVPTTYRGREFAAAGGLVSYGTSLTSSYHLAGFYTGRVLKGEKPADLPVQQATKFELYINLKTAKALGITVPLPLSGRADEVIE
jgi:putative tryptophan/tyrosine transport system substrate-binding protein